MATTTQNYAAQAGLTLSSYPCSTWDQARTGIVDGVMHVIMRDALSPGPVPDAPFMGGLIHVGVVEPVGMADFWLPGPYGYGCLQGRIHFGNVDRSGIVSATLTFLGQINSSLKLGLNYNISFDVSYEVYTPPGLPSLFKKNTEIVPAGQISIYHEVGANGRNEIMSFTLPNPPAGSGEFGILLTQTKQRTDNTINISEFLAFFLNTAVLTVVTDDTIRPPRPHLDPVVEFWTDVAANKILNMAFCVGGDAVALPDKLYLALYSSACTRTTPGTELSGDGYTRVEVPSMVPVEVTPHWKVSNANPISFPTATANWLMATHWAMWSDATGGEYLCHGQLAQAITAVVGTKVTFPIGWIALTFGFYNCPHPLTEQVMKAFFIQDTGKDPLTYFPNAGDSIREFALQFYTSEKPATANKIDIDGTQPRKLSFDVAANGKIISSNAIQFSAIPSTNIGKVVNCAALIVDAAPWPLNDGNRADSLLSFVLNTGSYGIPTGNVTVEIF